MAQELSIEDMYAQRVRLPLWGTLLIYGIGAAGICCVNGVVGAGLAFHWEGPLRAFSYGVVSFIAAGLICFIGLSCVFVSGSIQREGPIVRILGVILLATMILTIVQCKEPSASNVFESLVGYPPDAGVTNLRSFISQAEWQDSTTGLFFHVNDASLKRLMREWNLKETTAESRRISTIRDFAYGNDPIPNWFACDSATVQMKWWSWGTKFSDYTVFLDVDHQNVHVIFRAM